MANTNFRINGSDFDDLYIRRDIFSSGNLWAWGANDHGQIGDNSTTGRSSPVQTVAAGINWRLVAGGQYHTAAIKTDGTLWLWGRNQFGGLGDNSQTSRSSPVQVTGGGTNWRQVAVGSRHTAAVKADGTLWTWGYNGFGQLGNNTVNQSASTPVQTVAGGTNWRQVSCGTNFTTAIKTDGTLWVWGDNQLNALGINSLTPQSSPVQTAAGGNNWRQVAAGNFHGAAVKTDGTLWLWGSNSLGQLGDDTRTDRGSPVQTIAGGTNWRQVACGGSNTAAIKTDGTLWAWGAGNFGQLGDNTSGQSHKSSPVQTIAGGTNWRQVSVGSWHMAAIKTDGILWTWGSNSNGQLGNDQTVIDKSSPVQTVASGTNWRQVSATYLGTVATTDIY